MGRTVYYDHSGNYEWELYGDVDRITEWLDWLKEEAKP